MVEQPNNIGIAGADISSWRDLSAGRLVVGTSSIQIFSKKSFFKEPAKKAEFEISTIDSFKLESEPKPRLFLAFLDSNTSLETIEFRDQAQAKVVLAALRSLLGPLDEVSHSERLRLENERLLREQVEKRRCLIQSYSLFVWSNADGLRTIARGIYQIIPALKLENWDMVKEQYEIVWQQTDRLQQSTGFNLLPELERLCKAYTSMNGPEAVINSARFLETIENAYAVNAPPKREWDESEMQRNIRPNWPQLLYFHFFYSLCRKIGLDCEFGDWGSIDGSLSKLETMRPVMNNIFCLDVTGYIAKISDFARRKDLAALKESLDNLDAYLSESAKKHPCQEVNQSNGTLPKLA